MMMSKYLSVIMLCSLLSLSPVSYSAPQPHQQQVEVLHWWTSKSENKAVQLLKRQLEKRGITWQNFAIPGGAGENAMTVLKSRAISGNPPAAAQIKGPSLKEWASLGFLTNLDEVAKHQHWDALLPQVIRQQLKYQGHYVAVPINIHRTNWLWINRAILQKVHMSPPKTWAQFFKVADKIKAAGYPVLSLGNQDWQIINIYEAVALSELGVKGYRQAFIDHDITTLDSPAMTKALKLLLKIKSYTSYSAHNQNWDQATARVINQQAAMQITGDWANGEFSYAHQRSGHDFICVSVPQTQNQFIYSVDSFAMFQLSRPMAIKAQHTLARLIMSQAFQRQFNLIKGSIPVRSDSVLSNYNRCAQRSERVFRKAEKNHTLLPSVAHGMASSVYVQQAIAEVITHFFNNPHADPHQTQERLKRAILAAS